MGSDVLAEGLDCRSAFLDKHVLPGPCLLACSDMLVSPTELMALRKS
jgi:hypothetical protein